MGLEVDYTVGPSLLSDGAVNPPRLIRDGSIGVSEVNGRYYENTFRGNIFVASLQTITPLTGLVTAVTGLVLSNPFGSGKNLQLLDLCVALASAPAGISAIGLAAVTNPIAGAVVHTTPVAVRSAFLGQGNTAVGLVDSAATLPVAPAFIRAIGGGPVATGSVAAPFIRDEIGGSIILAPGTAVCLAFLTTAISVLASVTWGETAV